MERERAESMSNAPFDARRGMFGESHAAAIPEPKAREENEDAMGEFLTLWRCVLDAWSNRGEFDLRATQGSAALRDAKLQDLQEALLQVQEGQAGLAAADGESDAEAQRRTDARNTLMRKAQQLLASAESERGSASGPAGGAALVMGVCADTCLSHLSLKWNGLEEPGAGAPQPENAGRFRRALISMLELNRALTKLEISHNRIDYPDTLPRPSGMKLVCVD